MAGTSFKIVAGKGKNLQNAPGTGVGLLEPEVNGVVEVKRLTFSGNVEIVEREDEVEIIVTVPPGESVTVDSELSSTSINPVQNRVVNLALAGKSNNGHLHPDAYEPVFTKNTAFNKNFGTGNTEVKRGNAVEEKLVKGNVVFFAPTKSGGPYTLATTADIPPANEGTEEATFTQLTSLPLVVPLSMKVVKRYMNVSVDNNITFSNVKDGDLIILQVKNTGGTIVNQQINSDSIKHENGNIVGSVSMFAGEVWEFQSFRSPYGLSTTAQKVFEAPLSVQ